MEEFIFDLQRFAFPDDLSKDESGNYLISSPAELQALATYVNEKNECAGLTFKLTADIDMSSVANFTPIGTPDRDEDGKLSEDSKPFKGRARSTAAVTQSATSK